MKSNEDVMVNRETFFLLTRSSFSQYEDNRSGQPCALQTTCDGRHRSRARKLNRADIGIYGDAVQPPSIRSIEDGGAARRSGKAAVASARQRLCRGDTSKLEEATNFTKARAARTCGCIDHRSGSMESRALERRVAVGGHRAERVGLLPRGRLVTHTQSKLPVQESIPDT